MLPPTASIAAPLAARAVDLLGRLCGVFPQHRTRLRAWRLALGQVLTLGERTIARVLASCGRDQMAWSSDYRLFSRCRWETRALFTPVLEEALQVALPPGADAQDPLWIAGDHTHLTKCGRSIPGVQTMRDPMSPPYHVNLIQGLRFFHLAVVAAPWREQEGPQAGVAARAIPVRFEPSPVVSKPGSKATQEQIKIYKQKIKKRPASVQARAELQQLREDVDAAGGSQRPIIAALDGGFCNQVFFKEPMRGIALLCRCRRDAVLCHRAAPDATGKVRGVYAKKKFSPEGVLKDETIPWQSLIVRTGGKEHTVRCKEIKAVLWQRGAGRRELRLIVIAPTGYRLHKEGKLLYRQPAFLLTTDQQRGLRELVQGYVDRWQIEVAHRELKDGFGIQDSQVRNPNSVPRHPGFEVAVYAMLHLAALEVHGPERTQDYLPPPKWSKGGQRASLLDIVRLLRHQMPQCPVQMLPPEMKVTAQLLAEKAAA